MATLGTRGRAAAAALAAAEQLLPPALGRRWIHQGHVRKTLEKLKLPRKSWLKEVDQAPEKSSIRRMKDKYLREMGLVHEDMKGLFSEDKAAQQSVKPLTEEEKKNMAGSSVRKENLNEALRMYRLLRPDAPPFYEEDALLSMKAKMNRVLAEEAETQGDHDALERIEDKNAVFDPFKCYLPVVNQRAFLLALEAIIASVADDVETMCLLAGISQEELPSVDDPLRFKRLIDTLFSAFPLMKDGSNLDRFMDESWPKLSMFLPTEIAGLDEQVVAEWLRGHLTRVRENQRRAEPSIFLHGQESFRNQGLYNFAEDFPYDDDPMPGWLADERNLDFPLERAGEFMSTMLGALSASAAAKDEAAGLGAASEAGPAGVADQFQDLVWDLEKVGLRNWLRMDLSEMERYLPKGQLARLRLATGGPPAPDSIELGADDIQVAKMMLRCAARGRVDLLDFEAVDPYKLLHGMPTRQVDEELAELPGNDFVSDDALCGLVDSFAERLAQRDRPANETPEQRRLRLEKEYKGWDDGATIDEIYRKELDFYRTAGPVEWTENEDQRYTWKWKKPMNCFWDPASKVYLQERQGVDPTLNLKEMRQHLLEIRRMNNMVKQGRSTFFRCITVVGNGKGVYGFGVGFGKTAKDGRADAAMKALQNLDYIDLDPGRMLCTPSKGIEYANQATIIPRPLGRGLRVNKRFLPLVHILGLDNCKVKFMSSSRWFTRIRALRRALDGLMSRRTLANMTGKRYSHLVAPGDHWVHWPDRWFSNISKDYHDKSRHAKLVRRHRLHFKNRSNVVATELEVKGGWRKENWARWNNPLERWIQERRRRRVSRDDPKLAGKSAPGREA